MTSECRSCEGTDLSQVLDLGDQYLSDFRDDDSRPPRFPLALMRCHSCGLLQLRDTAPRDALYHPRYSYKSGVSDGIRRDLADVVNYSDRFVRSGRWLDIGCNDGTLLSYVPSAS